MGLKKKTRRDEYIVVSASVCEEKLIHGDDLKEMGFVDLKFEKCLY